MVERYHLRASCKCALYSPDGSKVLLSQYSGDHYGLPGGHIEKDETPDQAISRELQEELGLTNLSLDRKDFWLHDNGRIILGFTGVLDEDTPLTIQREEMSCAVWVSIADIQDKRIKVSSYDDFICKFQPKVTASADA